MSQTLRSKDSEILGARLESANQKIENSKIFEKIGKSIHAQLINCLKFGKERRDLTWSDEREAEVIRLAQETVESLHRQMSRKDEMIEKYRSMVKDLRLDIIKQKEVIINIFLI